MMNAFWWTSSRDKGLKWISWEKLCIPKKFGGMGFRLLHEFNLALLAKQSWRILSCPNSLLARVFKAKYLENRSFWEVGTSKNASFVRRGILRARSVLEKGMRWRIGSGREIKVWNDKWIPKGRDMKVHSPIIEEFRDLRVSDLIIEERGRRKWNFELLEHLFNKEDRELIVTIPLENNLVNDQLIWGFTANGLYSVKSGYWVAIELRNDEWRSYFMADDIWGRIWNLDVPGVVRDFAWRGSRDVVPTKNAIRKRINVELDYCELCSNETENLLHIIRDCVFAKEAWACTNFVLPMDCLHANSFRDWIRAILYACDSKKAALLVCFAWRLWNARNDRVWNENYTDVQSLFSQVQAYVQEWWFVNDKYNTSKKSSNEKATSWKAPDPGKWKFNVDAASFKNTNMFGWGGILRNHLGEVHVAISDIHFGGGDSSILEAKALEFAMRWAIDNGVKCVCFELDAQRVVQAMKNFITDISEFGVIINRCKDLINDFISCTFSFVPRDCNKAAHMLARRSIDFGCCMIWMEDYPSFIQPIILNEMKK